MEEEKTIVVVGGGFAGTTLVRELERRLSPDYTIVLVSEESYTTFQPLLPEALGASLFPEQAVAPIREMVRRARFIMGRVEVVDSARRTLTCATLAGAVEIRYAHVVLAIGNRARLDLLPGAAEHAAPLKTIGDALHIRNTVLRRLAQIELETDVQARERLGHFIVLGGGFSGVETAGELVDCLRAIARYYPRVDPASLRVTLLHDLPRLLPELAESLGAAAHRSLAARGVEVRTGVRAAGVGERGVLLASGEFIPAQTVICTIGTAPNPLVSRMLLPVERGRIVVDPDLRVAGVPATWAVGDCAIVRNAHDRTYAPTTAQFAVAEAKLLARNLAAVLAGLPTRSFRYRSRGSMAALGHRKGVAQIFGVRLSGVAAWLAWRAYYLTRVPTPGRKLRIFVEWTWGMFFPNDITHLRFIRSRDLDPQEAAGSPRAAARPAAATGR